MQNKLDSIIKDLMRCAKQNEADAKQVRTSDDDYDMPHGRNRGRRATSDAENT
jgi:hypothetical protein